LLARYREIRASVQRVLSAAQKSCEKADLKRGAKLLGLDLTEMADWPDGFFEMMSDLALFEPNQRGTRPFDRFLERSGQGLAPPDRALAERMAQARYSIFAYAERHEVGGVWLDDLLVDDQTIWLMDEALERSAKRIDGPFGMRVFDAGEFHAGFGIIVPADEDTFGHCVTAGRRGVASPFRHSIAATTYADFVLLQSGPTEEDFQIADILELLASIPAPPVIEAKPEPPPKKKQRKS
jgi:hypothetical protein